MVPVRPDSRAATGPPCGTSPRPPIEERLDDGFETWPDAVLAVRARLLRDRLAEGWTLTQLGELVAHAAAGPLRKRAKRDVGALGRGADVAHEPTFPAVAELAELLRADDELRALAEWGDLEAVRQKSPEFGAAFDKVLAQHRAPRARRDRAVRGAVRGSARSWCSWPPWARPANRCRSPRPPRPRNRHRPPRHRGRAVARREGEPRGRDDTGARVHFGRVGCGRRARAGGHRTRAKRKFAEKLAIAGQRHRELAVDATVRYTGELRRLVREWGRRQVHAGRLVDVDDAFYLTLDELLALPPDALARVERRRADRERLAQGADAGGGQRLVAAGGGRLPDCRKASSCTASACRPAWWRVRSGCWPTRRRTSSSGDVVVMRAADVGHAALLGPAAAIVTDLGGPLCRAAVVARELGVPCVTGHTGRLGAAGVRHLVRVDGATGDVTVLRPASVRA